MGDYTKYLILIVIGVCIGNIWNYIKRLELTNQMLANGVLRELQKQKEETHDGN